jgi:hypothetical protein
MATIEYQNPKDHPNRETKLKEYLDLLLLSNNLIGSQSSHEAFFYIGKFCRFLQAKEWRKNLFGKESRSNIHQNTQEFI